MLTCVVCIEGLTMHATILAYMFSLVELGRISVPLGPTPDNTLYVQEFVASLLRAAFPHFSDNQIKITVQGLFNLDQDIPAFKEHLRDFLVQIRVCIGFTLRCCVLCSFSYTVFTQSSSSDSRVAIRPVFPGHVLFFKVKNTVRVDF